MLVGGGGVGGDGVGGEARLDKVDYLKPKNYHLFLAGIARFNYFRV